MSTTNPDEYRFRCPNGHVTLRRIKLRPEAKKGTDPKPSFYCNTCKKRYGGKPIDLLEWKTCLNQQ